MKCQRTIQESLETVLGALSHELRTPLSVVSNELQYLGSLVEKSELERPLRRCREISEILNRYAELFRPIEPSEKLDLIPLLESLGCSSASDGSPQAFIILTEPPSFQEALKTSFQLFFGPDRQLVFTSAMEPPSIIIHATPSLPVEPPSYTSLTEHLRAATNERNIHSVWCSSVFEQSGLRLAVSSEPLALILERGSSSQA